MLLLTGKASVAKKTLSTEEVSSHSLPVATSPAKTVEWTLNDKYEWQHFTVTLTGVTANSRIGIGANRKNASGQVRMYLDNIQLKVVKYE